MGCVAVDQRVGERSGELSEMLSFSIETHAAPKERPRFSVHGGKVRTRTASKTVAYEQKVKLCAMAAVSAQRWTPDASDVFCVNVSVWRKHLLRGGDVDNLGKAVLDAMTGVVYPDDGRVVEARFAVHQSEAERVSVTVWRMTRAQWEPLMPLGTV
jgi:Holliday junction resolvase RusA-like endonuclease